MNIMLCMTGSRRFRIDMYDEPPIFINNKQYQRNYETSYKPNSRGTTIFRLKCFGLHKLTVLVFCSKFLHERNRKNRCCVE